MLRRRRALALLPLLIAPVLTAQDSVAYRTPAYSTPATVTYALGSAAVVASNAVWRYDIDHGGDPPGFSLDGFLAHGGSAFVLTQVAVGFHVKPVDAVFITAGATVAFDVTQGHLQGNDVIADVVGAVGGALVAHWLGGLRF